MGADPVTAAGVTGLFGLGGANAQGYAQEKIADENAKRNMQMSREQLAEQARQFNESEAFNKEKYGFAKQAYQNVLGRGAGEEAAGESGLMSSLNAANPYIANVKKDIAAGTAENLQQGSGQMQADLASQGIRGGQAGTLLARGTGNMAVQSGRDINQLELQDQAERDAAKRAYLAAKASRGQAATLPGVSL